ncbi:hypothetical protein AB0C15_10640 [Micromonospora sp. NPDC048835]|uniref:hypothetical protein n=1 Tax=Micromonospora sp. NPDC048835 TaxID=3155147 RepID=UPI0033DA4B9C
MILERPLLDRFVEDVSRRFPAKLFGFFLSTRRFGPPTDYIIMEENIRDEWLTEFHAYGNYYVDHDDAGFLCTPEETWRVERTIRDAGLVKVGVFHSHQRHPAILTSVDVDFHPSPDLWHLLVVLRNLSYPLVRTFEVTEAGRVTELPHVVVDGSDQPQAVA